MADAQSKAEKLAAARKKAEEMKKKKAKKQKAATTSKEEEPAAEPAEEKPKEAEAEAETEAAAAEEEEEEAEEAPAEAEPSTPTGAEPATTASPFAPTDTESTTHAEETGVASGSTAELEAKVAELEKELGDVKASRDEAQLMADALEKKVVSLEVLHKEDESHINRLQKDIAELKNENVDLKNKIQKAEADVLRLSKKEAQDGGGTDNDHLDELEDEERLKLETRVRELEAENTDLRRGIWHEKRRDMQSPMDEVGGQFTNVPLGGPSSPSTARKQGGFGDFFTSGLNALTGGGGHELHGDDDGFLDDDVEFDEEAFRKAQEEAARARIERIKEVKRGLKNWEGWRLDLVEGRRGGGEGIGEMFEI
ncbi:hypothetical protein VM1G_08536 [Cytospora mali]|uniref:Uncharacterized protein n=1 Tax=Cytospora mali TaxID=578113 RepID=A0A194W8Y9_CYTMA|nr:hypothetical protein VM1G_08536 [Valsa mali]